MTEINNKQEIVQGRLFTEEQKYYYEQSYKEPVLSIDWIEDVAKFFLGAMATMSGLLVAAYKLALGDQPAQAMTWFLPFIARALGIICHLLVILPLQYKVGIGQPSSFRDVFHKAHNVKIYTSSDRSTVIYFRNFFRNNNSCKKADIAHLPPLVSLAPVSFLPKGKMECPQRGRWNLHPELHNLRFLL